MTLHFTSQGEGAVVVFLHGMAASGRYWQPVLDLQPAGRLITIDLIGFGNSPHPTHVTYDYQTHVQAIIDTLAAAGVTEPFTLVGHSMGALIGLRLASLYPERVSRLILCGLPYYPSPEIAKHDITQSKRLWRLAYYGPTSKALCTVWCRWLRPITRLIAPLYLPRLPRPVAEDSLKHTWQAYSESLKYVIEEQAVASDLAKLQAPTTLLYGATDNPGSFLHDSQILAGNKLVTMVTYPGLTHQLPIEKPELVASLLTS